MPADLYWDWLQVPREKRPPNYFDLLGLAAGVEDAAAIEQAAKRQVERVKEHLDGAQAAEGAKLLQEIAAARATLLDAGKRSKYVAALVSPTGSSVQPWWQDPAKRPAAKTAVKTAPARAAAPPIIKPKTSEFQGLNAARRPARSAGSGVAMFAILGGAALVLIAAIAVAIIIFSSDKSAGTERAAATSQNNTPTTNRPDSPSTRLEPETSEPFKSVFLTQTDPPPENAGKPKEAKKYERHTGLVQAVSLASNGQRFLSGGEGGVFEWDLPSGKSFLRHEFKVPAAAVCYLPGTKLAACADEGSILVLDLPTNKVRSTLKNPRGLLLAVTACCDGKHLLSGGNDGTLRWWDIARTEPEKSADLGETVHINCLAISRDGKFAAVGCNDGSVSVWELPALKKIWEKKQHRGAITGVAISPGGKQVASASIDQNIRVWNSENGNGVGVFPGHQGGTLCVAFLEKSPGLVSGGRDGAVKFWSFESGLALRSLPISGPILCLAVAASDDYVIVGGSAGMLQMLPMPEMDFEKVAAESPPAKKLALPNAEEVAVAANMLRAKYKPELDQSRPEVLSGLAEQFLTRAGGKAQPPQRLALFHVARELFIRLGRLDSTFKTIEQNSLWFEIDDLAERVKVLEPLIAAMPAAGQKSIVDAAVKLLGRADAEARADVAKQILAAMDRSAAKSGLAALTGQVGAIRKQREQDAKVSARLVELRAKLKATPNDRDANLAIGLLLCSRHEWKEGLPHLVKGADAKLADLAKQDVAEPKEAKRRLALAQAWADAADKLDAKLLCLQRAKYWVELAEPAASAEDKPKATLLLGQVSAQISALAKSKEPQPATSPEKPKKKTESVVRRNNFNTFRNEATFKNQWKSEGSSRWENTGLRLLDLPVSIQSTFQLLDNWKMEIDAVYDGRELVIEVNKQVITVRPTRTEPAIYLERKGKKLTYALVGTRPTVSTISLTDEALEPSTVTIKLQGRPNPSRSEGMLIPRIVVNGPVKMAE